MRPTALPEVTPQTRVFSTGGGLTTGNGNDGPAQTGNSSNGFQSSTYIAVVIVLAVILVIAIVAAALRRRHITRGGYDLTAAPGAAPLALLTTADANIDQAVRQRMLLSTVDEARVEATKRPGAATVDNAAFIDPRVSAAQGRAQAPHPLAPEESEELPPFDEGDSHQYLHVGGPEEYYSDDVEPVRDAAAYAAAMPGAAAQALPNGPMLTLWEPQVYTNDDGDTEV